MRIRALHQVPRVDWVIMLAYVLLNAADCAITLHALHHVREMREVNPLARWALDHGDSFFICFKMGLSIGLGLAANVLTFDPKVNRVLLIGSALVALAVIWDIGQYVYAALL